MIYRYVLMPETMANADLPLLDVSVTSSFGSPIMFNAKRGLEASAGVLKDILLGNSEPIDANCNESFQSHADFEDLDEVTPQPGYRCQPFLHDR